MNPQRRWEGVKRARRLARIQRARWHIGTMLFPDDYADDGPQVKGWIKTRVPCSCSMCGNPRRQHNERTAQERKADEAMMVEMADYWGAARG